MALVLDTIYDKVLALFPSYNLKIKNYKDKHLSINP